MPQYFKKQFSMVHEPLGEWFEEFDSSSPQSTSTISLLAPASYPLDMEKPALSPMMSATSATVTNTTRVITAANPTHSEE